MRTGTFAVDPQGATVEIDLFLGDNHVDADADANAYPREISARTEISVPTKRGYELVATLNGVEVHRETFRTTGSGAVDPEIVLEIEGINLGPAASAIESGGGGGSPSHFAEAGPSELAGKSIVQQDSLTAATLWGWLEVIQDPQPSDGSYGFREVFLSGDLTVKSITDGGADAPVLLDVNEMLQALAEANSDIVDDVFPLTDFGFGQRGLVAGRLAGVDFVGMIGPQNTITDLGGVEIAAPVQVNDEFRFSWALMMVED